MIDPHNPFSRFSPLPAASRTTGAGRWLAACLMIGGLVAAGCSVNEKGLGMGGQGGGLAGGSGGRGVGGASVGASGGTGSGGAILATGGAGAVGGRALEGSGGSIGSGGAGALTGSGGSSTTGGMTGTGGGVDSATGGSAGDGGTGGSPGSGGAPGTGGGVGTGGFTPGSGGAPAGACNANNCPNGCCNGDRCMPNRNDSRCGTAGAACAACGACFHCSDAGTCALTGSSRWEVLCSSATIAPTKAMGLPWDSTGNGSPDPACRSTSNGGPQSSTAVVMDSFSPVWNRSVTPNGTEVTANTLISTAGRWGISVIDEDSTAASSDPICMVSPQLTAADFAAGTVSLPATAGCLSLTIQLMCAE